MTGITLAAAKAGLIAVGQRFDRRQWAPATAGNYSARLDDGTFAITVSGRHKGRLDEDGIMVVDAEGNSLDGKKPSAETWLHMMLYRDFPEVGAVLHSHATAGVALARLMAGADAWTISGHEMLKVLPGITTHETSVTLPIVDNSQDMRAIEAALGDRLRGPHATSAYVIRSHGLYGWGRDIDEAERVIEGVEWLAEVELHELKVRSRA
ncbi:methylthioribulose 1-phosphate dehydratase [Sphingomonas sp. GlSt437]|uniref:methylthioribulose 1-phosphate dehydratase n=1 Tax=Sphingomonas sp. GlSt437 TaxID=3389970 RepID=UPI003A8AD34F